MDEFSLIRRFFDVQPPPASVVLGIGDDAAILEQKAGRQLLVTSDTLVAGIHFPVATDPESIAHKALAVNLSDIAAMGGQPAWYTLVLSLPEPDESWLTAFSGSLHALARQHELSLIGGDTTHGPLSVSITMIGTVPAGKAVRRSGARAGDAVFVTGTLGDAALALHCLQNGIELDTDIRAKLRASLDKPRARVEEGLILQDYASAMIDISDGLAADLGHVLTASGVAADLDAGLLPLSQAVRQAAVAAQLSDDTVLQFVTAHGDDYELCTTVPQARIHALQSAWSPDLAPLTRIGSIKQGTGIMLLRDDGSYTELTATGYRHFT